MQYKIYSSGFKLNKIFLVCVVGIAVSFVTNNAKAQVRFGPDNTVAVASGAMVEVASSAAGAGFLPPKVALTSTTVWTLAGTAVDGMVVYNTTNTIIGGTAGASIGIYVWYSSKWNRMVDDTLQAGLPKAVVYATVAQGGTAANGGFLTDVNYAVKHNVIEMNRGLTVSADGAQITIITAGYYLITASVSVYDAPGGTGANVGERYLCIYKNTTYDSNFAITYGVGDQLASTGFTTYGANSLTTSVFAYLAVGDTLLTDVYQKSQYTNVLTQPSTGTIRMQVTMLSN